MILSLGYVVGGSGSWGSSKLNFEVLGLVEESVLLEAWVLCNWVLGVEALCDWVLGVGA